MTVELNELKCLVQQVLSFGYFALSKREKDVKNIHEFPLKQSKAGKTKTINQKLSVEYGVSTRLASLYQN